MDDQEREDGILCIEGLEKMLRKLDTKGMQYFHHLCDEHGEVSDFYSFRKFFESFLTKFPKKELTSKYNTDEEARKVWTKIDTNLNEELDRDESINVVKEMLIFVIDILKRKYNLQIKYLIL